MFAKFFSSQLIPIPSWNNYEKLSRVLVNLRFHYVGIEKYNRLE